MNTLFGAIIVALVVYLIGLFLGRLFFGNNG